MEDNWCALFIATQLDVSPEVAFNLLTRNKIYKSDDITKDMIALKNRGCNYKEIGIMYGLTGQAAYRRIKRFKERIAKCTEKEEGENEEVH